MVHLVFIANDQKKEIKKRANVSLITVIMLGRIIFKITGKCCHLKYDIMFFLCSQTPLHRQRHPQEDDSVSG